MDHEQQRLSWRVCSYKPPMMVDDYIRCNMLDSVRIRAILADHAILTPF